jgi:flagellin-like protein
MNDRRGFRRRQKQKQAVSPVVATLILILIAVAAAAALYLWLVAWQGGVTGTVGTPGAQDTVTIGGSTSAYPFDQLAVTQFQQNNSDIAISNNQGGTAAGMIAVCAGNVNIGVAGALETVAQLQEPIASGGYGCQQTPTPVITTVAYDAVDIIVPSANAHGLVSIGYDTLLTSYIATGGGAIAFSGSAPHGYVFPQVNGIASPALTGASVAVEWEQLPACVNLQATCGGAGNPTESVATGGIGAGIACTTGIDICQSGTDTSPCGYTVCAGPFTGTTGTDDLQAWARYDVAGTEQTFTARLLGIGDSAGTSAGLGYTGCSPSGQLLACGISPPSSQLGTGDSGVISGVAAHPDALGFASDGLARASGSGVAIIPVESVGQAAAVLPTTGSSGSIAGAILGTGAATNEYQGWRPFDYVTLGTPTGESERFIQFVLQPQNNQNFATEASELSIYSI